MDVELENETGEEAREGLVRRALALADLGRTREAVGLLTAALAHDPQDAEVLCHLGVLHDALGERRRAMDCVRRAMRADPLEEWAHRLHSHLLFQAGKLGPALRAAEAAVRLDPEGRLALQLLVLMQLDAGGLPGRRRARATAERLRRLHPDWAESHDAAGRVALTGRRWAEAEGHFRRALALQPDDPLAMDGLAQALRGLGRGPEAVALLADATRLAPDQDVAPANLHTLTFKRPVVLPVAAVGLAAFPLRGGIVLLGLEPWLAAVAAVLVSGVAGWLAARGFASLLERRPAFRRLPPSTRATLRALWRREWRGEARDAALFAMCVAGLVFLLEAM